MRLKLLYLSLVAAVGLIAAPAARAQRIVYCDGCRREIHLSRVDAEERLIAARERADRNRERAQERAESLRERNREQSLDRAERAREHADRAREQARERAADRAAFRPRVYRNRW